MTNLAQINFEELQGSIATESSAPADVGVIISRSLIFVFAFAGIGLLVYLVIGGFQLMTSGGDPKKAETAKSVITNAFIGFIIIFISYWLVQLVGQFFGLDTVKIIFPQGGTQ